MKKKPEVTRKFIGMLRDRLMAIPIREYFEPNKRKIIADRIEEEFVKNGVKIKEKCSLPTAEEVAKATKRLVKPTASARKKMNQLHLGS